MTLTRDWFTPCRRYALRVTATAWRQIDRECAHAGVYETGGILIGHYSTDGLTATVTEAVPPPRDSASGPTWFHRGTFGLRGLLAKRWKIREPTHYLGEWHYHPSRDVEPSSTDLVQMAAINADPNYRCREPLMIIVGQVWPRGQRPARAFVFPSRESYVEFEQRPEDEEPDPS